MALRDAIQIPDTETDSPGEFERLRRFILYHLGGFTLGLVRVNDPRQRDGVIASLSDALAADNARLIRVDLANRHPADLRQAVLGDPDTRALLDKDRTRSALAIVGLEHLIEAEAGESGRPPFAAALNLERDALPGVLPVPLILFLTDHAMDRLDLAAPDFFDWYSGVFRLRSASAPTPETAVSQAKQVAESRQPYSISLSPDTLAARLDLLEERRTEFERAGPEARLRLAQVLKEIGEIYADLPELDERQNAVLPLRRAAEIFHEEERKAGEAGTLKTLGDACYWIDDYKQAKRRYEAALPIYRDIGARLGEANCIKSLGDVHVRLSEYAQARARYEAALPIYREIGARLGEANTLIGFGDLSLEEKNYALAREWFERALGIYREIGVRAQEANTLNNIGNAWGKQGKFEEAIVVYSQAIAANSDEAAFARNRASALIALGRLEEAQADCETASRLAPDHPYTHRRWGDLHLARGEWIEAEVRYRAALTEDDSPGWRFGLPSSLWGLGHIDEGWAEFNSALAEADPDTRAETSRDYRRLLARHPALPGLAEAIERLARE